MIDLNKKLQLQQLDKKLENFKLVSEIEIPPKGWINAIRKTLNMSLAQLGKLLKKTPQSVKEIEEREQNKSITLKGLIEVAAALNLRFVYGFVQLSYLPIFPSKTCN